MAGSFLGRLRGLLFGTPFGETYPRTRFPQTPSEDGRTHALRILREYIAQLTFYRSGGRGKPVIPFTIPIANIQIEDADDERDVELPSISFVQTSDGIYDSIGLTSYIEEESRDVYAPGTVLQWQSEYTETFDLEIIGAYKAEVRAILSGLEVAMVPTEQMYGIRFTMPSYYRQLVCFTLNSKKRDNKDVTRGRRTARMRIEMRHNVVALVPYVAFNPSSVADVRDEG